jgi:hypothetical protein
MINMERPAEVNDLLARFLDQVCQASEAGSGR